MNLECVGLRSKLLSKARGDMQTLKVPSEGISLLTDACCRQG